MGGILFCKTDDGIQYIETTIVRFGLYDLFSHDQTTHEKCHFGKSTQIFDPKQHPVSVFVGRHFPRLS